MYPTPDSTSANLQQTIADLQRRLAEARAERDESEAQKAALAQVLGVINASPGDLGPMFDTILDQATRLCDAAFGLQNLQHRMPDHQADRTQGGQNHRPAVHSTIVLSGTNKSGQAAAANSP